MSDVVERVRMALAEIGYDPNLVRGPRPGEAGTVHYNRRIPIMVAWRARETALLAEPKCLACLTWQQEKQALVSCLAERRFMEDCGVERPA